MAAMDTIKNKYFKLIREVMGTKTYNRNIVTVQKKHWTLSYPGIGTVMIYKDN